MKRRVARWTGLLATVLATAPSIGAQAKGAPAAAREVPRTARTAALYDITGYWISVVTEDWRLRMITPPKGDYTGIALNAEGRKLAGAWDPSKDEAAGEQCRSYGAPNIMRLPGRLHITWQDDQTLKIETDAGRQTRLLYFGTPQDTGGGWQGLSKAMWEMIPVGRGAAPVGSLKVVTTNLKPGYLRRNGVPYGAAAVLTEYIDRVNEPSGDSYLVISSTVEDPTYLAQPFLTASHYKKQSDSSGWNPTPCTAR